MEHKDKVDWDDRTAHCSWCYGPETQGDDAVVDATQGVLYLIEIKEHVAIDALVPQVMEIIVAVWKPTVTVERDHRRARSPDSEADHRGDFEKNGGADC